MKESMKDKQTKKEKNNKEIRKKTKEWIKMCIKMKKQTI